MGHRVNLGRQWINSWLSYWHPVLLAMSLVCEMERKGEEQKKHCLLGPFKTYKPLQEGSAWT